MLALCIDTSYKILSVSLIEDGKLIAYEEKECFKRQSEEVFCFIDKLNKARFKLNIACFNFFYGGWNEYRKTVSGALESNKYCF